MHKQVDNMKPGDWQLSPYGMIEVTEEVKAIGSAENVAKVTTKVVHVEHNVTRGNPHLHHSLGGPLGAALLRLR